MSVRATAFWDVGGFDADTPGGGEEEDVCRRLRARYGPGTVMIHPEVIVAHDFARSVWANLHRSRSYGFGAGVRWVREGGLPTLRPAPLALLLLGAPLAEVSVGTAVLVMLVLPYCVFSNLTRRAVRLRDPEAAPLPRRIGPAALPRRIGPAALPHRDRWRCAGEPWPCAAACCHGDRGEQAR
jgi:hypothetical protein